MTLAVTAQRADMRAELDPRFGRAPFFILIDTESGRFRAHDNRRNLNLVGRAGVIAARDMVRLGVDALITERVGPRTFRALQSANVDVYVGASGRVADAAAQFERGELERIGNATVDDHWRYVLDL